MRILYPFLALSVLLGASACASTGPAGYQEPDLQTFTQQCEARGGLPRATGQQSGRPQLDYVCEIRNAGQRVPNP